MQGNQFRALLNVVLSVLLARNDTDDEEQHEQQEKERAVAARYDEEESEEFDTLKIGGTTFSRTPQAQRKRNITHDMNMLENIEEEHMLGVAKLLSSHPGCQLNRSCSPPKSHKYTVTSSSSISPMATDDTFFMSPHHETLILPVYTTLTRLSLLLLVDMNSDQALSPFSTPRRRPTTTAIATKTPTPIGNLSRPPFLFRHRNTSRVVAATIRTSASTFHTHLVGPVTHPFFEKTDCLPICPDQVHKFADLSKANRWWASSLSPT